MVQVQSDGIQHDVGQSRSPPRHELLEKLTGDHLAKLHVIYHESKDPNAIPLLLLHGWPGSAFEFIEGERSEGGRNRLYHSLSFFPFDTDTAHLYSDQDPSQEYFARVPPDRAHGARLRVEYSAATRPRVQHE